jgi:Flp pilus assembly protein TadD
MVIRLTWLVPVVAAAIAGLLWRRTRWPLVALAVLVLSLAPMLGLSRFDFQRYSTVADRYAYFAMLAPAMLLAAAAARAGGSRVLALALAGVIVVALAVGSAFQLRHWHDDGRFFALVASRNPDSLLLRFYRAEQLVAQNHPSEALDIYRATLEDEPNQPRVLFTMGKLCLRLNRVDDAIAHFQRAAELSPNDARVLTALGVALAQRGNGEEALAALQHAVASNPGDADAHLKLAIVFMGFQRGQEARREFEEVIRLNGNVAAARRGLSALNQMPR